MNKQIFEPCQRTKKTEEHEVDSDTNCNLCPWNRPQTLGKKTRAIGKQRKNGDHSDFSIDKIDKNTHNNPGHLKGFAVTQTPVKVLQLRLV